MLLPLVLLFIAVPIAELAVIIQVGQAIGVWWTIAILLADSLVGSALMRSQGRAAWRRFNAAMAERRVPAREVIDGVLVVFGGALLITPGFLSDILGLALLFPPTRAIVRRLLVRRLGQRLVVSMTGPPRGGGWRGGAWRRTSDYDVDGHAVDLERDTLDPPAPGHAR